MHTAELSRPVSSGEKTVAIEINSVASSPSEYREHREHREHHNRRNGTNTGLMKKGRNSASK